MSTALSGGDGEDEANEPDFEAGEIGFKVGLGGQFAAVDGGKRVEAGGDHAARIGGRGFECNLR